MEKISRLLNELEAAIPLAEKKSPLISQANVGWHIEHSLLVIHAVLDSLRRSDPALYKWKFSMPRIFVYSFGTIPRGRGKAPAIVQPNGTCEPAKLYEAIKTAKEKWEGLDKLPANSFFKHPYFGHLNVKPTRRFLAIHTEHHLKIIREIINQ